MHQIDSKNITTIIGLGNPGPKFEFTPHNIGFLILDELCDIYNGTWQEKKDMLTASIIFHDKKLLLVKPQTFMNLSGHILPQLQRQGIKQNNILVVHDEIDYPFGKINFKQGGSARGHNGLRSLIDQGGQDFARLRVGVGRPEERHQVSHFVTAPFQESNQEVANLITKSIKKIESTLTS